MLLLFYMGDRFAFCPFAGRTKRETPAVSRPGMRFRARALRPGLKAEGDAERLDFLHHGEVARFRRGAPRDGEKYCTENPVSRAHSGIW